MEILVEFYQNQFSWPNLSDFRMFLCPVAFINPPEVCDIYQKPVAVANKSTICLFRDRREGSC